MKSAIELEGVSYSIAPHFFSKPSRILSDICLRVYTGRSLGIVGANGAGKTTILKICAGIIHPDSGTVRIMGEPAFRPTVRKRIGFLSETPYVYPHLKLREWLEMMGRLSGIRGSDLLQAVEESIQLYGLSEKNGSLLHTLSKGQLQRAAFAQATLHCPDILILDEPMSGMDPFWRHRIKEILLEMKAQGKTLIFSSHIISDILRLSDKIVFIESGRLKWEGTIAQWPKEKISYHVVFKTEKIDSIKSIVEFSYLSDQPDGSFGGTIPMKSRDGLIQASSEGHLELISLTPEYSNLRDLLT